MRAGQRGVISRMLSCMAELIGKASRIVRRNLLWLRCELVSASSGSAAKFPSLPSVRFAANGVKNDIGRGEMGLPGWVPEGLANFRSTRFFMLGFALLTAILYYLGAKVGFLLTFRPHPVSTLWPPNAILAAMLLLAPRRQWWLILVAVFPAHLAVELPGGVPLAMVLGWFMSNCTEALVCAACVRLLNGYPVRFDSFWRMIWFIVAGAAFAPLVSSFLDAGFVTLLRWGGDTYWEVWRMRFWSNGLAMLTVVPVLVMTGSQLIEWLKKLTWKVVIEGFLLTSGLLISGTLLFNEDKLPANIVSILACIPMPFLLWAAIRFGPAGLSGSVLLIGLLSIWAVIHGRGPFGQMTPAENAFSLQLFLIALSVPLMLLSAVTQERQNAARVLNESEARFRAAADGAPIMLWVTGPDKGCTFVNKRWVEFTGKPLSSHLGDGWTGCLHPDDLQSNFEIYVTAFDRREAFRMDYRLRRANGEYGWVVDQGVPRFSVDGTFCGYVGTAIDVTDAKKTEAALRESDLRYRQVVESQHDLVCSYLPDTTLTLVNEAFCRFFGKRREELVGHSLLQLNPHPPDQHARALERIHSMMLHPKIITIERPLTSANGVEKWHQWVLYPVLDEAGTLVQIQAIGSDITERRKAEESLRATHQQVNSLARQLIHAQEEERRRIARELHDDFNQRLAAHAIGLSNFRQTILSGGGSLLEKVGKLEDEAVSLSDDIRLIAHELHPAPMEQGGFESTLRAFCGEFSTRTRLEIDLEVDVNTTLPGDVALCCYRVVQESLSNIAKHARARRVQVFVQSVSGSIILLVADDGVGVEEKKLRTAPGLGITSMAERIEFLSGEFHIGKRKNGGTLIAVEVPIS
jgi:PAS domain S-box-containing protein